MEGPSTRHRFAFTRRRYRLAGLCFGITPRTTWVELTDDSLHVRFGPWSLTTPLGNVDDVQVTGGFGFLKAAGPARLSRTDRGIAFATNGDRAVCLTFQEPVPAIEPTGRLRHPGATLTVADVEGFVADVEDRRHRM